MEVDLYSRPRQSQDISDLDFDLSLDLDLRGRNFQCQDISHLHFDLSLDLDLRGKKNLNSHNSVIFEDTSLKLSKEVDLYNLCIYQTSILTSTVEVIFF